MKFKRTITLAILAAVLSANLASCVAEKDPNKEPNQTYTDEYGNKVTQRPAEDPTSDATKADYTDVSKTVYVRKKSTLTPVNKDDKSIALEAPAKLECFAQATEWYKVRYDGTEYYIARGRTTDDDVEARNFVNVNEEMTVCVDSANIRKYPSAEDFSDILTYAKKGEKVTVVGKNVEKKWYKVKYTSDSKTYEGYIKYSSLTEDYSKKFTAIAEKTVYVVSESAANLRLEPIAGVDGGTIVDGKGVPRGTKLTAIAEGDVNGLSWFKVYYTKDDGTTIACYVAKSEVSEVKPDGGYTLEELIEKYHYTKFSTEITAYPYQNSINVRETPSGSGKLVEAVQLPSSLTLYAYGESLSGGATWCLVKTKDGKTGFAWCDSLTLDSTGKTLQAIPLSLDHLLAVYSKYEFNKETMTKTSSKDVALWTEPGGSTEKAAKKLSSGTSVKIVASSSKRIELTVNGTTYVGVYYIVEVEGIYYFALQSAFN